MDSDDCLVPGSFPTLGSEPQLCYGSMDAQFGKSSKLAKSRPAPVQLAPADVTQPDRRASEPGTPSGITGLLTPSFLSNFGLDMFDTTPTMNSFGGAPTTPVSATAFAQQFSAQQPLFVLDPSAAGRQGRRPSDAAMAAVLPRRLSERPTPLNLAFTAGRYDPGAGAAVGQPGPPQPTFSVVAVKSEPAPPPPQRRASPATTTQTSRGRIVKRPAAYRARSETRSPTRSPSPAASRRATSLKIPAIKHSRAARDQASPLPIKPDGVLPTDHRPARGRGRQQQLKQMTAEQIEAEAEARLEKNRLAARECRMRRKEHMAGLEGTMQSYITRDVGQKKLIKELQAQIKTLQRAAGLL